MTLFEILNETNANLVIEENSPGESNFTKAIIFRFDGKKEYIIHLHCTDEILELNNNDRITIKEKLYV